MSISFDSIGQQCVTAMVSGMGELVDLVAGVVDVEIGRASCRERV